MHHPIEAPDDLFPHRHDFAGRQSEAVETIAVSPRQRPEVGVAGAKAAVPVSAAAAASRTGQVMDIN